ncbi:hypothetical protein G6F56_008967 [Rhizopus delemar]|nr:hypothetical protein G6F56_008967 [Rhizopus delemar]
MNSNQCETIEDTRFLVPSRDPRLNLKGCPPLVANDLDSKDEDEAKFMELLVPKDPMNVFGVIEVREQGPDQI